MNEYECNCGNIETFEVLSHPANDTKAVMCVQCGKIWLKTDLLEPRDLGLCSTPTIKP